MKLKKFFAGVVAAAMMLTMGATAAFAAGGDGTQKEEQTPTVTHVEVAGKTFEFDKEYTKTDGVSFGGDTITFAQDGTTAEYKETLISETSKIVPSQLTFKQSYTVEATTGTPKAKIEVTLPDYHNVGVYTYTVKETSTTNIGVTPASDFHIVVTVVNGANNGEYNAFVRLETLGKDGKYTKASAIENTYTYGAVNVTKNVTGNMGNKDKTFSFKITLTATGKSAGTTSINLDEKVLEPQIVNEQGALDTTTGRYTFKDNQLVLTFKVKAGATAKFDWIPVGVNYTVVELDESNGNTELANDATWKDTTYTVSYSNNEGTVAAEAKTATITNSYTATIDTGVILDNAPYIALLAIVVFGGVALMLNKRRRDEE